MSAVAESEANANITAVIARAFTERARGLLIRHISTTGTASSVALGGTINNSL